MGKITDPTKKATWASNVGRAMRKQAEAKKCPNCGKKNALKRHRDAVFSVAVCRYGCGYEKGHYRDIEQAPKQDSEGAASD